MKLNHNLRLNRLNLLQNNNGLELFHLRNFIVCDVYSNISWKTLKKSILFDSDSRANCQWCAHFYISYEWTSLEIIDNLDMEKFNLVECLKNINLLYFTGYENEDNIKLLNILNFTLHIHRTID